MISPFRIVINSFFIVCHCHVVFSQLNNYKLDIPDRLIVEAYEAASTLDILAAVNSKIFFGYFSVCADGKGYGYGNTYPSLDGHQMSDALLWLGQTDVVKANWDYVKKFQKQNGALPLAILPAEAGKNIGPINFEAPVDPNGGLYKHWVPKDPLRSLAGTTFIQNADVIFRLAALNKVAGNQTIAQKYEKLAHRIENHFRTRFWVGDHFAEYIHPERGTIAGHGLTDVDWSAIALGTADGNQTEILWPKLKDEKLFYYGGMPTGITTKPDSYEKYNEYPANLIRIVQRCLFGIEYGLDGTLYIAPTVPEEYWRIGFGQRLNVRNGFFSYKMNSNGLEGEYNGTRSLHLSVAFIFSLEKKEIGVAINGRKSKYKIKNDIVIVTLPSSEKHRPATVDIKIIS